MTNNKTITPVISYFDSNKDKKKIVLDNKNKSGIYRWYNKISGKSYIGSAKILNNRLNTYYSTATLQKLLKRGSSLIYRALLKYGYSNFSLDILEYCSPDLLLIKEQYYIDILNPEYNILKIAGSRLNYVLSEKLKLKLSLAKRGKIHKIKNIDNNNKLLTEDTKLKLSLRNKGVKIKIFDSYGNFIKEFPTIKTTAKYLNLSSRTISRITFDNLSYYEFILKYEIPDKRIWVHNNKNKLIKILENIKKVSEEYNIPKTTLQRYIKSKKIYNNKYYFYNKHYK